MVAVLLVSIVVAFLVGVITGVSAYQYALNHREVITHETPKARALTSTFRSGFVQGWEYGRAYGRAFLVGKNGAGLLYGDELWDNKDRINGLCVAYQDPTGDHLKIADITDRVEKNIVAEVK